MDDTRIVFACALATGVSAATIMILLRIAEPLGLVDRPDYRKRHVGNVPLVGGLAVFCGVVAGAWWLGYFGTFAHIKVLLGTTSALALLGALDDRHDLSVRSRLLVQTLAVLVVAVCTDTYVRSLGHLFGHELSLGWLGIPFTVIAVIGLLNAFNMVDGIDGLAGGLCLVSIGAILLFDGPTKLHGTTGIMALMAAALLPYLVRNLNLFGRKIFMGDAGSMVIGYLLAWALIEMSQSSKHRLSPVDVLWCVALPVLDTLAVMYRRIRQGKSPFKPDRGHVHHIIMGAGLTPRATLACLIALAATLALLGSVTRVFGTEASLATFGLLIALYILVTTRLWARQLAKQKIVPGAQAAQAANDTDMMAPTARSASHGISLKQ
jgi:UDP-GlcNAc:undecaprenyl-phosphate/decaprenyl-phosphate GlcNAc-1-phosphate transferase